MTGIILGVIVTPSTLVPFSLSRTGNAIPTGPLWMFFAVIAYAAVVALLATLVPTWFRLRGRVMSIETRSRGRGRAARPIQSRRPARGGVCAACVMATTICMSLTLVWSECIRAACEEKDHECCWQDRRPYRGERRHRHRRPATAPGHLDRIVGYIKSHQSEYLPEPRNSMVAKLTSGQRTPVFRIGTSWDRYSWYLRLPSEPGSPWAGIVRVEASPSLSTTEAVDMADLTQRVLPRYASKAYKDSRAPQNLYPIGGLERHLRHRLGDQQFVYRALRSAAG